MIVGYVRVSTDKQDLSVDAQREKIKSYAKAYDLEILDENIIVDEGCSAKNLDRDGIQEILNRKGITAVVVTKLDRLTRSVRDLGDLLEGPFKTIQLISISEHLDTKTASGRLMLNLLVSVSSWEREVIGERTSAVLKDKQRKGQHVGRAPFGKVIGDDGVLKADPLTSGIRAEVIQMRDAGLSLREIQKRLEGAGTHLALGTLNRMAKAG